MPGERAQVAFRVVELVQTSFNFNFFNSAPSLLRCASLLRFSSLYEISQVNEGEGVVGFHPILRYGEPAFVYQSQTPATADYSFSGSFLFAPPGSRFDVTAGVTEVTVPKFKFSRFGHLW
jgi:hypothetical protein